MGRNAGARVFSANPANNTIDTGIWSYNLPVLPTDSGDIYFLAMITQTNPSDPGCSGRLWFLQPQNPAAPPIAIGLHWGVKKGSMKLALVTDLIPSLQHAAIRHVATEPQLLSH